MQPRSVTLVLSTAEGRLLGQTPPFQVDSPWWQEVGDVVEAARARFGIHGVVLRLLASERARPPGGWVAYLAETDDLPGDALLPPSEELALRAARPSPRRAAWAAPGGHRESLAWVRAVWPEGDACAARQRRTWNLSSLWQLQPGPGRGAPSAWLKQVPPFLGHEAAVLGWLAAAAPGVAPRLLASDGAGRMLLEHVQGADCFGASGEQRETFALVHHQIQLASVSAVEALARRGVPDRRGLRLARELRARLSGRLSSLPRTARFVDQLDAHMARIESCAIPDALVHGDLHPGNVRQGADSKVTILDWGDSVIANPAFDLLRLSAGAAPGVADALATRWSAWWRQRDGGCQPERVVALIVPLVPLRAAATYAHFIEQIEESEHPFHASDVTEQLECAERILADGEHTGRA